MPSGSLICQTRTASWNQTLPCIPAAHHIAESSLYIISVKPCIHGASLCLWSNLPVFQVEFLKLSGINWYRYCVPCTQPSCDALPVPMHLPLSLPSLLNWQSFRTQLPGPTFSSSVPFSDFSAHVAQPMSPLVYWSLISTEPWLYSMAWLELSRAQTNP